MSGLDSGQALEPYVNPETVQLAMWLDRQLGFIPRPFDQDDELPQLIGVYGPWGCGKSTAIRNWTNSDDLKGRVVTYRADNFDHEGNPLESMVTELLQVIPRAGETRTKVKNLTMKALRSAAPAVIQALVPALVTKLLGVTPEAQKKLLETLGFPDEVCDALGGAAVGAATEAIFDKAEGYENAVLAIRKLVIVAMNGKLPIVLVVDELDRCRPDFALQVIELARNLASEKLQIILCLNRHQLENYLSSKYEMRDEEAVVGYLGKYVRSWFPFRGHSALSRVVRQQADLIFESSDLLIVNQVGVPLEAQNVAIPWGEVCAHVCANFKISLRQVLRIFEQLDMIPDPNLMDFLCLCLQAALPKEFEKLLDKNGAIQHEAVLRLRERIRVNEGQFASTYQAVLRSDQNSNRSGLSRPGEPIRQAMDARMASLREQVTAELLSNSARLILAVSHRP